jgi:hypothetical protein
LYEAVASRNDSILHVASMSEVARVSYFENYIDTQKRRMKQIEEKRQEKQDNRDRNSATTSINPAISAKHRQSIA